MACISASLQKVASSLIKEGTLDAPETGCSSDAVETWGRVRRFARVKELYVYANQCSRLQTRPPESTKQPGDNRRPADIKPQDSEVMRTSLGALDDPEPCPFAWGARWTSWEGSLSEARVVR